MTTEKMNIHQKLVEIRKSVKFLKKESQGHGFKFTSSSQVIMSIRDKMNELNVLLIPRVTGSEVRDHKTQKGNHQYFTALTMEFEWVDADNPKDRFSVPWYGQGLDDGEKGVGKALTYAEKYLILKQFNIPTDKDDPDGHIPESKGSGSGQKSGKMSDADAKKEVGKLRNSLGKCDTDAKCSKWWKDSAGIITKLPKKMQDDITKGFTEYRAKFFKKCIKGNPDEPVTVKIGDCSDCDTREGCPAWEEEDNK